MVDEHLTGFENLEMIGRLYRFGRKRTRVRAGALVAESTVLILDEPTTGLDPRGRATLWDTVQSDAELERARQSLQRFAVSGMHSDERDRSLLVPSAGGVATLTSALWALDADGVVIARRYVIKIERVPEVLVFVRVSPIMFVLLFAYVFGNAINIPGGSYREFLIGGIFAQTVMFGATFTGVGLAEDMQQGIIDRFRSWRTTVCWCRASTSSTTRRLW